MPYLKGQRITDPVDGKVYVFIGGSEKDRKNYVEEVSTKADIGLSTLSGGAQGAMDLGQGMATPVTAMLGLPGNLLNAGMNWYRRQVPEWTPQTIGGRYAGAGTRGAVGSSVLGPMGILSGLTGGIGGEAGADLTGGSKWGRLAGSILGATVPNVPSLIGSLTTRRVANATQNMGPEDWAAAQRAQEQAAAQGIQVTGPEAIGQKAPDLLSKQLLVEQHPKSASIMAQVMNERPQQVKTAVRGMLDQTGAPPVDPALLGVNVQKAAGAAIDEARQAGNVAAQASYRAAEAQRIPIKEWDSLRSNRIVADALDNVKKNPYYGVPLNEPAGSILWLDAAKKYLDDAGEAFKRGGQNYAASQAGQTARNVRSVADATSQDYATARKIVEQNMRSNVEPRQFSATGAISETANPNAQFKRLTDASLSRPGVITQAAKDLQMTDPAAYQQLVRNGLENEFDTAMKQLQTGGQQFGGARFVRSVRGTDQTRANIEASIRALPDGNQLVAGWNKLLDTLELTGNRLPVGSRTAFNQAQQTDLTGTGVLRQTLSAQPLSWLDRIEQNLSARSMAKLFTDPESVAKMKKLAVTNPQSAEARILVSSMFGADQGNK